MLKTATEDFSQSIPSIAEFITIAMIRSWVQRRKLQPKVLTSFEEYDIATKIQAGYRNQRGSKPETSSTRTWCKTTWTWL